MDKRSDGIGGGRRRLAARGASRVVQDGYAERSTAERGPISSYSRT